MGRRETEKMSSVLGGRVQILGRVWLGVAAKSESSISTSSFPPSTPHKPGGLPSLWHGGCPLQKEEPIRNWEQEASRGETVPSPPATIPEVGPRSSTLFSREGRHCAHTATESERELTLRPGRALENMPWGAALGGLSEGGCDVD